MAGTQGVASMTEFPEGLIKRIADNLSRDHSEATLSVIRAVLCESGHAKLVAALKLAREDIINTMETFGDDDPATDKTIIEIDAALCKAGAL